VRKTGAFIPGVEEIVVETCRPTVLTAKNALHLRALASFVDIFGKHRKVGDEWLVTSEDSEVHIPDVYGM
jgi:major vault protein